MKRLWMIMLCGLGMACSGAESTLFDPMTSNTSMAEVDAGGDETAVTTLPTDDAATCTGFADPSTASTCHACTSGNCQANGCFGGYFCKLDTLKCVPKPDGC